VLGRRLFFFKGEEGALALVSRVIFLIAEPRLNAA